MERLTDKHYSGDGYYMNCPGDCDIDDCGGCIKFDALVDKLGEYEDAEEQGRLVVLPCKIGTPVWSSVMCRFDENGEEQPMQWPFMLSMMDEWGTGFFLTYEEAKAALKGETEDV